MQIGRGRAALAPWETARGKCAAGRGGVAAAAAKAM